jgi:DNA replication and repair protein RecF
VVSLSLGNFRCHRRLRLELTHQPVVLTGDNGSGKTSVLEALSMLAPGRGLRRARLADLAHRGVGGAPAAWAVSARLQGRHGPMDVSTGWSAETGGGGRERRHLRIDGQPVKGLAQLAEAFAVLWLTPDMDRVFTEGAAVRRRFLDRLVYGLDPAHATRLNAYERALQQRSALLRQGAAADPGWLAAIEDGMAASAVAIVAARRDMAARLGRACRDRPGPFPAATLAVAGDIETWLEAGPALAAEDRLRTALAEARQGDAAAGSTRVGAHRTDVLVHHAASGRPAAACSTGEQKTLLIAIVLAAAEVQAAQRGQAPLLLLDEVAAHLDAGHRRALFAAVGRLGVQAWYAGTDRAVFGPLAPEAQFIRLGDTVASPRAREEQA